MNDKELAEHYKKKYEELKLSIKSLSSELTMPDWEFDYHCKEDQIELLKHIEQKLSSRIAEELKEAGAIKFENETKDGLFKVKAKLDVKVS